MILVVRLVYHLLCFNPLYIVPLLPNLSERKSEGFYGKFCFMRKTKRYKCHPIPYPASSCPPCTSILQHWYMLKKFCIRPVILSWWIPITSPCMFLPLLSPLLLEVGHHRGYANSGKEDMQNRYLYVYKHLFLFYMDGFRYIWNTLCSVNVGLQIPSVSIGITDSQTVFQSSCFL